MEWNYRDPQPPSDSSSCSSRRAFDEDEGYESDTKGLSPPSPSISAKPAERAEYERIMELILWLDHFRTTSRVSSEIDEVLEWYSSTSTQTSSSVFSDFDDDASNVSTQGTSHVSSGIGGPTIDSSTTSTQITSCVSSKVGGTADEDSSLSTQGISCVPPKVGKALKYDSGTQQPDTLGFHELKDCRWKPKHPKDGRKGNLLAGTNGSLKQKRTGDTAMPSHRASEPHRYEAMPRGLQREKKRTKKALYFRRVNQRVYRQVRAQLDCGAKLWNHGSLDEESDMFLLPL